MLAFLMSAIFGILYLVRKDLKWDTFNAASVEIGLMFTVICILSGMIWHGQSGIPCGPGTRGSPPLRSWLSLTLPLSY